MLPGGFLALVLACAFAVGLAINHGSTCAVTAARQLVEQRHGTMLTGFAIAIGAAGLVCLPLRWLLGPAVHLAAEVSIGLQLIIGAVLIGIGAVINDACLLGTLSRIGHGELRFLAMPPGLALGFALAAQLPFLQAGTPMANPHAVASPTGIVLVAGFAMLMALAWWLMGRMRMPPPAARAWPRGVMVVMGGCGALLFALEPGWTYSDAIHAMIRRGSMDARIDARALAAPLALLGGAIIAGLVARTFVLRRPTLPGLARSLAGGAIMAVGGTLIPGGNDSLMLSAVPAATISGMMAYAIMSITVPALLWLIRAAQRTSPSPTR